MKTKAQIKVGGAFVAAGLVLSGCTSYAQPSASPSPSASDLPAQLDEVAAETLKFAETLMGMAEDYAVGKIKEAGYEHRVVWRDGVSMPVTMDYRPTRINLYIKEGIVDRVEVG